MKRMLGFIGSLVMFATSWLQPAFAKAGETRQEVCNVVQAAFTAITKSQELAYPRDIRASSRPIPPFEKFVSTFVAEMQLREGEWSDLLSQQSKYATDHFLPECDWRGKPQSVMDGTYSMRVEFSNPVFSSDSRLAIVEVSFFGSGRWGYGNICILRKVDIDWTSRCIGSWIA